MIQVCYDEKTGAILYTVDGDVAPDTGDGAWVAIKAECPFDPSLWLVDGGELVAAPVDKTAVREGMVCSRLQGRLVLGEKTCALLDAIATDPGTPWAMRETIINAGQWFRTSQTMDELAWVLGFEDDQMDGLFMAAMDLQV